MMMASVEDSNQRESSALTTRPQLLRRHWTYLVASAFWRTTGTGPPYTEVATT